MRTDINTSRHRLEETLDTIQDNFEQRSGMRTLQALQTRYERVRHQASGVGRELSQATEHSGQALGQWIQAHPLEAVAAAFAFGVLLGARPFK